jgi:hypothetical protein
MIYGKTPNVYFRDHETKRLVYSQYATPELEYLKDCEWVWTEKIDGMNLGVTCIDGRLKIFGRNGQSQPPEFLMTALEPKFQQALRMWPSFEDKIVYLFGEGFGAKIQKRGALYSPENHFALFAININGKWLSNESVLRLSEVLNLSTVPQVGIGTLREAVDFASKGFHSTFGDFPAEGIVCRPKINILDGRGGRIICKIQSKDFINV